MRQRTYRTTEIFRRLLTYARPYWPHIVAVFLLNLLTTPLKLLGPLPVKIAIDNVLHGQPLPPLLNLLTPDFASSSTTNLLIAAALFVVLLACCAYVVALAIWLLHTYTAEKLVLDYRARLLRHLQTLPLAYHDTKGTTDSTYRLQYDAQAIQWVSLDGIQPLITSSVTLVAMFYVIARIDWQLALLAIAIVPPLLLIMRGWRSRLRREWTDAKELESSAISVVQESLDSLRVVRAFGTEKREETRFYNHANAGLRGQLRVAFSQGLFDLMTGVLLATGTALALYVGIRHVQSSAITLGDFWMVWAYLAQLYTPLQAIGKKASTLQGALASADRTLAVLDEVPKVQEKPDAVAIERCAGRFQFENVDFAYRSDTTILQSVRFEVPAGSCVGIIGPTGAGKSTLAGLLLRFYDPQRGRILLDGVDLRDYRLDHLRNQFSVVLQEPILFSTTIAENIAYARPDATMEQIERAAQAANAHQFILRAAQGYSTMVGGRGMQLSGGERQRIALARAFLKDAPCLILDEPTSAVDMATEDMIVDAMQRLIRGRTTFLITHRTSLLEICDTVMTLKEGRLTPQENARGISLPLPDA